MLHAACFMFSIFPISFSCIGPTGRVIVRPGPTFTWIMWDPDFISHRVSCIQSYVFSSLYMTSYIPVDTI